MNGLIDAVEGWTGHRFEDTALLLRALTHSSYKAIDPGSGDYERLEFLGDGAVNLHAALMLGRRFPDASNADLTNMRQTVVATDALGVQGRALGIDGQIRLGGGIDPAAIGRITGDVVEALFGALMVEAGFDATHGFAARIVQPLVDDVDDSHPNKPWVNQLQEHTQQVDKSLPTYLESQSGPDHDLVFEVTVTWHGETLTTGRGRSKKEARERAARLALKQLRRGPGAA